MGEKKIIAALIEGGKATAGPPLGPALGPLGVNVFAVANRINELTKDFSGMKVPVEVVLDKDTKEFEVQVGTPTTSALIIRELKVEKGSKSPGTEKIGDLSLEQVMKISKMKSEKTTAKSLKGSIKEVVGACISMGVTVDGKDPREVLEGIEAGNYDDTLGKEGMWKD